MRIKHLTCNNMPAFIKLPRKPPDYRHVNTRPRSICTIPRPRYRATQPLSSRRNKTTEAGNNKSGHIDARQNEGIFFLDGFFPLNFHRIGGLPFINVDKIVSWLSRRFQNPDMAAASPEKIAQRALRAPLPIKVTEVLPRLREGGAFVKFAYELDHDVQEIERRAKSNLKEHPIRPWFNPARQVKTYLVQGRPWVEDLYRIPDPQVKVEFVPTAPGQQAEELSQETLYSLFRKYGKLVDIMAQPTDSKDLPKFALLNFNTVRHAVRAKNCMHGFVVQPSEGGGSSGTMLKLTYEQRRKAHNIWNFLINRPRLIIPLLIAFFGTFTMMIFDP